MLKNSCQTIYRRRTIILLQGGQKMIFHFEKLVACKICGSTNTKIEFMLPTLYPEKLRGKESDQPVEIFCGECGKINRTNVKMQIT